MQDTSSSTSLLDALKDTSFNEFVTLKLLKFIYILGLVMVVLSAVFLVLSAFTQGFGNGLIALILAPIVVLLTVLVLRVYMELIAVVFRIAKNTREIADNTAGGAA